MAVGTLSSNAFGLHAINPAMSIPLMEGYEKASQTFKDGAILNRDTGTLAVAGADNTADIVGVAAAPASRSGDRTARAAVRGDVPARGVQPRRHRSAA